MTNAIIRTIEKTMNEGRPGRALSAALYILSLLYTLAVRVRLALYGCGILKKTKLPCPVISVGNITVGGTGKTPLAIFIAGEIAGRGKRVVVLSRGYGGSAGGVSVVSNGDKLLMKPDEAGDEPCLMASRLNGVPVIVGRDRVKAGLFAIERFKPDFIILDDGFQHIRLERDLNIMLLDSSKGFGNGHLVPRGILREGASAVKRADFIMVKGTGGKVQGKLPRGISATAFTYRPVAAVPLNGGAPMELKTLKNKKAVAVCAIAAPESFFSTLDSLGVNIVKKITLRDHHPYTATDVEEIKKALSSAEIAITTEKDAVKLNRMPDSTVGLPIYALKIDVELKDAAAFKRLVNSRLPGTL